MDSKTVIKESLFFYYRNVVVISVACLVPALLFSYVPEYFLSGKEGFEIEISLSALCLLIAYPLSTAATLLVVRRLSSGEPAQLGHAWTESIRRWLPLAWLTLIKSIAITLGLILLVAPGIWLAVRLSFSEMYVVFENESPGGALKRSYRETEGLGWVIFGAIGTFAAVAWLFGYLVGLLPSEPDILIYIAWALSVVGFSLGSLVDISAYRILEISKSASGHNNSLQARRP